MRNRVAVTASLTALMIAGAAVSAAADPLPGASTNNGQPTATVTNTTTVPGSDEGGGSGGGGMRCTYEELAFSAPMYELPYGEDGAEEGVYGTSSTGRWATRTCFNELGQEVSSTVVPLGDGGGGTVVVDPRVLLEEALARLQIPDPSLAANPPVGSESLVQVPTWLWLDGDYWQARSATASAGGASATVTAEPVAADWSMGDGTVVACDGPGEPWSASLPPSASSPCSHTYLTSSSAQPGDAYDVTVTVTWSVSWTSSVPGVGGDLDDQTRAASVRMPVAEIQALGQ